MDYLCEVYSNIARLVIHNRQEQVFTPVSRYGTQTEYIVELKRNLRNRYKSNPQHNGRQNHSCVFIKQNINRTYYIIELVALVLVPKNIAKFSTTENKQTRGSRQ